MSLRTDSWRSAVEQIRRTMTARGRSESGLFSIEGTRLHERALRAGARVERCLIAEGVLSSAEPRLRELLVELQRSGTDLVPAPEDEVARLTAGRSIGALVGLIRIPPEPDLGTLLERHSTSPAVLLVAVEVDDPGNVGALIRTGLATGAAGFVGIGCSDPYHPRAVRTSMGSLFRLPSIRLPTLDQAFSEFARHDVRTVAAVSSGGQALPETDFGTDPVAVLLGSESFGLPADALSKAAGRVSVPMADRVDSLSVNAAAAILLYHLLHGQPRRN